jgi:glycosyltransferase involved in cell wall biosynthesis
MDVPVRKKRVVFVIPHLGPGGAQRVATTAANALVDRRIDVHVITVLDDHADAYDLDSRVCRHRRNTPAHSDRVRVKDGSRSMAKSLSHFQVLRRPLGVAAFGVDLAKRTRWLRRTVRAINPDAVLSFLTQTNIMTLLATRGLSVRTVVSERNDPRLQHHRQRVLLLRRLVYPLSDIVTANSQGAVSALETIVPKQKLAFLPNPLSPSSGEVAVTYDAPTIVTVTRLVEQKGVDVLLKAAARAFDVLPEWRLVIVGDGPLRDELQALAGDLGIDERVDWIGQVADPVPYLRKAKFFVLTSRFEGSPNALLEAMACSLPAVVSGASPGPLELIGEDAGLIVPVEDVDVTADAIIRLAQDEALRVRLGTAALARTRVHELDNAMQIWLELLGGA